MVYYTKGWYEYNLIKFKYSVDPITRIKARRNCSKDANRDSSEANNLKYVLYLSVGLNVMLTSNLWTEVGLHYGYFCTRIQDTEMVVYQRLWCYNSEM